MLESELATLLKLYRVLLGDTREEVAKRLRAKQISWFSTKTLASIRLSLAQIEKGGKPIPQNLPPEDLIQLANAYRMSTLMLDPLDVGDFSRSSLKLSLDSFRKSKFEEVTKRDGVGDYTVPPGRLQDAEMVFVKLELQPGQKSDSHFHPGDELIFMLEGTAVEVRLANNGLRSVLKKHDFIHFYAEHTHSVRNTSSEKAELFIVRLYQLKEHGGTRGQLAKHLIRLFAIVNRKGSKRIKESRKLTGKLKPWLLQLGQTPLPNFQEFEPQTYQPSRVVDPNRLALVLRSQYDLQRRGKKSSHPKIYRLSAGSKWKLGDLREFARRVGVPPILWYTSLFPRMADFVIVRKDEDLYDTSKNKDLAVSDGVNYLIPIRNLLGSDIDILFLILAPGEETPENHHGSFELLMPLGPCDVAVSFGDRDPEEHITSDRTFLIFDSQKQHSVKNRSKETIEILVIRFYRSDQEAR